MLRVRLASFAGGFAVAGGASLYLLQRDVWASHQVLTEQVRSHQDEVEKRLSRLEAKLATSSSTLEDSRERDGKQ